MKSGAAMDSNLQLRSKLSRYVQRHINESVEDWRITLDNFTSTLEDVKLQVKSNSMSHDAALNEIGELLLTFHDPDENFKKYEKHATFLLDIHASDVEAALVNDFTNLVKDWNSLNVNIESYNNTGGNSADKERITKADIGAEDMSVETLEIEKSSDHQISIDEGFEDDTSAPSIETFDVDVISSISIDDTSQIDTDLPADIQVDVSNDRALELLTNTHDFSYVDKEVDMSADTEIDPSHIGTEVDLSPNTEVGVSHIETNVDLAADTEVEVSHLEEEVDLTADTDVDVPRIDTEVDLAADTEFGVSHIETEVDFSADTEVDVALIKTKIDLSAEIEADLSHIETEVDFSPDTEGDVSHIDKVINLSADNEFDNAYIGTENEETFGIIWNEMDTSTVADGVDHADQSNETDLKIDVTAEQVDVDIHVPCSIEASTVHVEEESPIPATEVNTENDLMNPIDIEPSDGSSSLENFIQFQALESKVEVDSEITTDSSQNFKDLEPSDMEEEEKEEEEVKDAMVPIEVKDVEADLLNNVKHSETIVDYTDDEAKVPSRRNSNFFLKLCCCGFYRANTKTYY